MRRYLVTLAFALCAAPAMAATEVAAETSARAPVAVQHARVQLPGLRDEAAMVLVGTALIGLAAAVRRAA